MFEIIFEFVIFYLLGFLFKKMFFSVLVDVLVEVFWVVVVEMIRMVVVSGCDMMELENFFEIVRYVCFGFFECMKM